MAVIYKITNPKGLVYIGQTVDYNSRMRAYKGSSKKSQPRLRASLTKYGFDNHKFEIICECEESQMNELERFYQDAYNVMDKKSGLNLRLTEATDRSGRISEETKQKLRDRDMPHLIGNQFRKGIPHSEADRLKISQGLKGKMAGNKNPRFGKFGDQAPFFGRKHSEETLAKLSESQKGKHVGEKNHMFGVQLFGELNGFFGKNHSDETKVKMRKNHGFAKKVVCTSTGVIYSSVLHASEMTGMSRIQITRRLDGKILNNTTLVYL